MLLIAAKPVAPLWWIQRQIWPARMRALSADATSAATRASASSARVRPARFARPHGGDSPRVGERSKRAPKTYDPLMNAAVHIADQAFAPKSGPAFPRPSAVWQDATIRADPARVLPRAEPGRMASGTEGEDFAGLIEAVALRQDRAAFTRVFAYYGPRVKAYLLRLGLEG